MKTLISILSIMFCLFSNGQNLIPNGGFEDTLQLNFGLTFAKKWTNPTMPTTNHYHPDGLSDWSVPQNYTGYQNPKSGNSYMGILMYSLYNNNIKSAREYLQTKLTRPLSQDSLYCLSFYVSLADSMQYSSRNQLGVYFSEQPTDTNTNRRIYRTPQIIVSPNDYITDKTSWLKYDFEYLATGGEEYMTIGNFNDTNLIDTLFVGGGKELGYQATYYYIDDIWLSHCDSTIGILENYLAKQIKIYPNPIQEQFTIQTTSKRALEFQLFNVLGSRISTPLRQAQDRQLNVTRHRDKYTIAVGNLPQGIYFLQVSDGIEQASFKLIKN